MLGAAIGFAGCAKADAPAASQGGAGADSYPRPPSRSEIAAAACMASGTYARWREDAGCDLATDEQRAERRAWERQQRSFAIGVLDPTCERDDWFPDLVDPHNRCSHPRVTCRRPYDGGAGIECAEGDPLDERAPRKYSPARGTSF